MQELKKITRHLVAAAMLFGYALSTSAFVEAAPAAYAASHLRPGFAGCKDIFPKQKPISIADIPPEWAPTALCSSSFAVVHAGLSKTPLVVVEKLNRAQLTDAEGEERTDEFFADPRLPARARAELSDYKGSKMDRGHLAPAADQPDDVAMAQSFALSNMVPQDPTNNRKIWAKLESDTRKYAKRAPGNVYVYSGPIFEEGFRTIGSNKVWVPTHLFKLVYDEARGRAWAHVLPNTATARISAPMSYSQFVSTTGRRFLDGLPGIQ